MKSPENNISHTADFAIAFPDERRFDDRALNGANDGADFEAFVFEVMAGQAPGAAMAPRLARGRDGAIDLLDDTAGDRCVVECKFIGRNAGDTGFDRWREVRNRPFPAVTKLASSPEDEGASPYRPWLDAERPIREYRFCASAPFATQAREDELPKAILKELSSTFRR